jgi:hypothetical protein
MTIKQKLVCDITVFLVGIFVPYVLMVKFYSNINTKPNIFMAQNILFFLMIFAGIVLVYLANKHRQAGQKIYRILFGVLEALSILSILITVWLFYAVVTLRGI